MVRIQKGFTLIELMIVVAVIAILAAIAYPSYQEYVRRTKRVDMQASLMQIADQIQRYKIANFKIVGATASDFGIAASYPTQGGGLYTVSLTPVAGVPAVLSSQDWILTATPITGSAQEGNGHLVLNSRGERCWTKGTDINSGSACTPSATSNWDGR